MPIRPRLLLASSVLFASAIVAPALAQGGLPIVNAQPRDIGMCRTAADYRGSGAVLACDCPAGAVDNSSVWGTDTYTDDSAICPAALHRGVIGRGGGRVTLQVVAGQSSYKGSSRNGVTSGDYGSWAGSYRFVALPGGSTEVTTAFPPVDVGECSSPAAWRGKAQRLTCVCPGNFSLSNSVWGSDTYTDDSYICKAALHAGVLGRSGGRVTVELLAGRTSYSGSTRNGIATSDYGSWAGSYRFVR